PQGGKRQQAAGLEHPLQLGKKARQLLAPLDGKAAKHQIHRGALQRQLLGIPTHPLLDLRAALTGDAEHTLGDIQTYDLRLGKTLIELGSEIASATTQVEDTRRGGGHCRRQTLARKLLQKLVTHRSLQLGHRIVAGGGSAKGLGYTALVERGAGFYVRQKTRNARDQ